MRLTHSVGRYLIRVSETIQADGLFGFIINGCHPLGELSASLARNDETQCLLQRVQQLYYNHIIHQIITARLFYQASTGTE